MTASSSPVFTCWPSLKLTCASCPSTRLFTLTVLEAVTLPRPFRYTGTSRRSAVATATGTTVWVEARAVLVLEPALQPTRAAATATKARIARSLWRDDLPVCRSLPRSASGMSQSSLVRMLTQSLPRSPLVSCRGAPNRFHIDARNYIPVATYLPLLQDFTFHDGTHFRARYANGSASRISRRLGNPNQRYLSAHPESN